MPASAPSARHLQELASGDHLLCPPSLPSWLPCSPAGRRPSHAACSSAADRIAGSIGRGFAVGVLHRDLGGAVEIGLASRPISFSAQRRADGFGKIAERRAPGDAAEERRRPAQQLGHGRGVEGDRVRQHDRVGLGMRQVEACRRACGRACGAAPCRPCRARAAEPGAVERLARAPRGPAGRRRSRGRPSPSARMPSPAISDDHRIAVRGIERLDRMRDGVDARGDGERRPAGVSVSSTS